MFIQFSLKRVQFFHGVIEGGRRNKPDFLIAFISSLPSPPLSIQFFDLNTEKNSCCQYFDYTSYRKNVGFHHWRVCFTFDFGRGFMKKIFLIQLQTNFHQTLDVIRRKASLRIWKLRNRTRIPTDFEFQQEIINSILNTDQTIGR